MYEYKRHAARVRWLIISIAVLLLPKIFIYIKINIFKITWQEILASAIAYAIICLFIQVVHNPRRHYPEEDAWEEKEKEKKAEKVHDPSRGEQG